MSAISISVRQLVEFILRAGNIDTAYISANRALEGTRVHQHVQKLRKAEAKREGANYEREVTVDYSFDYKGLSFLLKGRADGIRTNPDDSIIIEEIKSTMSSVSDITDNPEHWHWAQAKCYGYMFLAPLTENDRPPVVYAALTYGQVETSETKTFTREFSFDELSGFFFGLLDKYYAFAKADAERINERDRTAKELRFPFGRYRPGQREFAVAVFAAVKQKKKLFAQAPTGIGKTISTLFPAVKSLAEGNGVKCFYLTAKVVARQVAEEAMRKMKDAGLVMRCVTITAKNKICFLEERKCNPVSCTYANGHFDRVNGAVLDILISEQIITREIIEAYAQKHTVCPSELQLDASLFCDVIICDYNHAYDPKSKLQRFFANGGDYILLNDEAHNLIDRARDMFSAGLYKSDFDRLRKELGKKHPLYKAMGAVSKEIRKCWTENTGGEAAQAAARTGGEAVQAVTRTGGEAAQAVTRTGGEAAQATARTGGEAAQPAAQTGGEAAQPAPNREPFCREHYPDGLTEVLFVFTKICDEYLQANPESAMNEEILDVYFSALDYLRVTECFDDRYAFFCEPRNGYVRLYCLDPSAQLNQAQKKGRACVFFSATLTPLPYFRALLGGATEDFTLRLASPFNRGNLFLAVDNSVSTRYKDRASSYGSIASRLYAMVAARAGNYIAFFPSYAYLNEVYARFAEALFQNLRV